MKQLRFCILSLLVIGLQTACGQKQSRDRRISLTGNDSTSIGPTAEAADSVKDDTAPDQIKTDDPATTDETTPPPVVTQEPTIDVSPVQKPQAPLPTIKKWYTKDGKIFDPNGKQWFGVGSNLSGLMGQSHDYIADRIAHEASIGFTFVRLWAPNHNTQGPIDFNERIDDLIAIMDIIHANHMQVMVVLWDTYMDLWGETHDYFTDINWFKSGYKKEFLTFVKLFVTRAKDHPALFMYQLANESSCRKNCADDYINMYADVAQQIRQIDPVHLISPGGLSLTHAIGGGAYNGDINKFAQALYKADDQVVWTDSIYNHEWPNILDIGPLKDKIPLIVTEYGFCWETASGAAPKVKFKDPNVGALAILEKWHASGIAAWDAYEANCGYGNPKHGDFNITEDYRNLANLVKTW